MRVFLPNNIKLTTTTNLSSIMTFQTPNQTHNDDNADEASSLLTVVTASPASSSTKKKHGGGPIRAVVATCFLGTLAMIYSGSRGSSSNISSTANLGTVAVVTADDSCATEVPGEGPCCDGGTITSCFQVCDYLLMCDNGYVPEQGINDDAATQFPETSDYQPHNCHCRGYEDHNGCFCHQLRDMIEHSVKGAFVGECDPCLPPPTPSPTHSPTARTAYIPLRDLCFEDKDNYGKYCWYPAGNFPDPIFRYPFGNWKLSDGRSYYDCGPKCSKVQIYDPDQDDCFSDNLNYDKYCWYGSGDGIPVPVGQWTRVTGRAYHDSCGLQCEDVMDIGG